MSWLIPYNELTIDQQRAVELSPSRHQAIVGGPGTGKTQVLLHRARYLYDHLGISPEKFRLFVYTNALKDYIKSAIQDLRLPDDNVLTFDHWCRLFYEKNINRKMPWNYGSKMPDFEAIRRGVIQFAVSGKISLPIFDFVLVDEGQDLEEDIFAFLTRISRHITVCIDNKQQIYDNKALEKDILLNLGIPKHNINLIDAFRVCPYLVEVATQLIPDLTEREAFRNQTRQPQKEKQTPLIYFAKDFEDERQMLYQIVRERLLKNESIAILLPQNRQVFGFAEGLNDGGIEVEVPKQRGGNNNLPTHDFTSSRPKIMPYHSAKGLTFDSVLMPRLVQKSFSRLNSDLIERLLFVGVTRATKWCYFSTSLEHPLSILMEKIAPLAQSRKVTLLQDEEPQRSGKRSAVTNNDEGDLDFL